jgi:hypothetical protein
MTLFDYSTPPPTKALNLIPAKTVALVRMDIIAGGIGEEGMLTRSKSGACDLLSYSMTVLTGAYAKRKLFGQFIVESENDKYGDQIWRSRKMLRRILLSAFNLDPNDVSSEARAKLKVDYEAFNWLAFYARVGIEPERDTFPAKNILAGTVTRNEVDWPGPIKQDPDEDESPASDLPPAASPAPIPPPPWMRK